jgi:transposase
LHYRHGGLRFIPLLGARAHALGHAVRPIPPVSVKPYAKRGNNGAVDAEAICEAMSRPGMRFVPVKSAETQATLMLHKTRELLVKRKAMSVNAARAVISASSA